MKKQILVAVIALVSIGVSSSAVKAQTRLGAQLVYGSQIENIGLGVNGEYFLNDNWVIAPSFNYFFPKGEGDFKLKWFEINANAHYYFDADGVQPYALAGLNFSIISIPSFNFGSFESGSASTTKVGLNIGGGVNFDIGSDIKPFAELHYILSSADQLVIGAGVRFPLN